MHKTPIPAVGWVLMWTREICDTKGFTKCLEIFQQVPWNCPLLSAPISTISCRPFSPARADKNVLFCMTLKESKLAGPHIAPASTIVFLLPVCEAGFCQCMNGGCSICQGWAKVWVGQSDSDKKKWFLSKKNNKVGLCLCKKSSHGQPSDWTVFKLTKFTCFKYPVIIQNSCHKYDISVGAIWFTSQSYHRCFYVYTRSLGALRAPTSRLRPFGPAW